MFIPDLSRIPYCIVVVFLIIVLWTGVKESMAQDNSYTGFFKGGFVHVISSSHQDIGWMDSPEKCIEARDEKVITPALERMKENPGFCFVMENTMCLMEYLKRHPERREDILRFTKSGQFEWGATYNQPYESMYSGEALVRQVYLGRKYLKKTLPGCDTRAAWNPDVPGRAMQMPQILAKAGIKYLHMSRHEKGFYNWLSPDGSGVLAFSPGHYHWSGEILRQSHERGGDHTTIIEKSRDIREVEKRLSERLNEEEDYYRRHGLSPYYGIIFSTDFSGPANLDRLFEEWNTAVRSTKSGAGRKKFIMPEFRYATGTSFLDALSEGKPQFDTIVGERPNVWLYIHGPTHHRAISAGREAARLLTAAEKFAAFDATLSGSFDGYPEEELNKAWAEAIFPDHGWGGYNGHITDRLFRDKMESGRDTAREILDSALKSIASRIAVKSEWIPVVVFNPLSWKRTDTVGFTLDIEGRENTGFRLLDALGQEVSYQVISGRNGSGGSDEALRLLFTAVDVPSLGYKTYYLEPYQGNKKRPDVTANKLMNGKLENSFYRIEFSPGGIKQIFDKELGKNILKTDKFLGGELFTMQSVGNGAGEFAAVQQPTMEGFEKLSDYEPQWLNTESGPVRSVYETAQKINFCTIRQRIKLYHDIKRIDFEVDILGWDGTQSREFRLAFPLNMEKGSVAYDVPMGVVEVGKSEIAGTAGERYVQPCVEVRPREVQDWFSASGGDMGVTISSSVAVFDWVDPTENAVSYPVLQPVLLASRRSCHGEGNWYLQAGDHSFCFSLFSHHGGWRNGYRTGMQSNRPLEAVCVRKPQASPSLPEEKSFISVQPGNVIISAVKKCDDDDTVIVRCYEIEGKNSDAVIEWFTTVDDAELTNIIEEEGMPVEHGGRKIYLKAGHYSIETVKLAPQKWAFRTEDIIPPSEPELNPAGGVYKDSQLNVTMTAEPDGVEIRYTLDGSEPIAESWLYTGPITLKKNTVVMAQAFRPGKSAGKVVRANYRIGMSPAVKVSNVENGLDYEYFEGSWTSVPDFGGLKPVGKGRAENIGLESADGEDNIGLRFSGYIEVPRDGVYTFYTESDDGSKVYIDEQLVVENDGLHWPQIKEGTIALKKGKHTIVVDFFEQGGDQALEAGYEGPGIKRQKIPNSVLFRRRTE